MERGVEYVELILARGVHGNGEGVHGNGRPLMAAVANGILSMMELL